MGHSKKAGWPRWRRCRYRRRLVIWGYAKKESLGRQPRRCDPWWDRRGLRSDSFTLQQSKTDVWRCWHAKSFQRGNTNSWPDDGRIDSEGLITFWRHCRAVHDARRLSLGSEGVSATRKQSRDLISVQRDGIWRYKHDRHKLGVSIEQAFLHS